MSVQEYIAKFEDLTLHCDVREHHSQVVTRFVWDLRSKIRRVIITGSYDLDTIEEAFDVTLKMNLTFKKLVNPKPDVLNVRNMDIMIISASQRVNMLELCQVIILMIRKLLRMSTFFLRLLALSRIH